MTDQPGTLFVVATPIGNLADLTARAAEVLAAVDLVAAEDTRRTGQLLTHLGIDKQLISLHEHNESARVDVVQRELRAGRSVAIVSDAGTPLISDPGYRLVAALRTNGLPVSPVPGCSAVTAALSVAGLPTDRFRFDGFLPARATARRQRLRELAAKASTWVCFESVHRISDSLQDIVDIAGADRPMLAAREMTKRHETLYRGAAADVRAQVAADPGGAKGEYTLVIAGRPQASTDGQDDAELKRVVAILLTQLAPGAAAPLAARLTGATRGDAYAVAQRLRDDANSGA